MDALELLTSDHDEVRGMFESFRSAHESEDAEAMGRLSAQIFQELEVHTAIEEEVFYPAVRDAGGGELNELTDESKEEHHVVDLLMAEIRSLDPSDDAFAAKMTVLMENVEHHAGEEEDEMFPEVRKLMSEDRLQELGAELETAKRRHQQASSTKEELYEKASEMGIEGRSSMTKDELAEAVGDQAPEAQ
jgi:hemerythrin superfamily protein